MQPYPQPVKARIKAGGGGAAVSLLEVQGASGNVYLWSDVTATAVSVLLSPVGVSVPPVHGSPVIPVGPGKYDSITGATADAGIASASSGGSVSLPIYQRFLPWIAAAPTFTTYKSTQASSGRIAIQNLSGNSIQRDTSVIFSRNEFLSQLVFFRLYQPDCQYPLLNFQGYVNDVSIDTDATGNSTPAMTLSLEGLNLARTAAPCRQITGSCQNIFASMECGSTSLVPCNNDYGSCTSRNRYAGVVLEWTGASLDLSQYAQPQPLRIYNGKVRV